MHGTTVSRMQPTSAIKVTRSGAPGFTDWQLRKMPAPFRGVRIVEWEVDDPRARLSAALLCPKAAGVLTDLASAQAWGLPVPHWTRIEPSRPVSVAVPPGQAQVRVDGIRGRRLRLPPEHVTSHRGLDVTTPARTWLDCAALIPPEYLVAMGDAGLRRRLAALDDLQAMVTWARRRRGVVAARATLPMLDPWSESPGESMVRYLLVIGGVPRPQCNVDIHDAWGGWLARADLAWVKERVIVEYDGQVHLSEDQRRRDAARRNLLQDAGWIVIVVTARDLRQPWHMCALVVSALRSRQR